MSIGSNIKQFGLSLPQGVTLVAVSKFHPLEAIKEAYEAGQRVFGESRAQELMAKQQALPNDIEWHFIGPLQSNKVKEIAPFVHTIHSIDSLKLLQEVNKQANRNKRIIRVLLEVHIAKEETKFGFTPDQCITLLTEELIRAYPHVQICGLMGMATHTNDEEEIRREFHSLHTLFDTLRKGIFKNAPYFESLSMGMSDDYLIALDQGSTLIRIGSLLFGDRAY